MQGPGHFDPVHQELCDFIQLCDQEKSPQFCCIMPRGSYKTTMISKWYAIWKVVRNHAFTWLIYSNTATNASMKLRGIKRVFENHVLFRTLFPELIPNMNAPSMSWSDRAAQINPDALCDEATFESAGIGSQVIGRHYDGIIEDDTCAPEISDVTDEHVMPDPKRIQQAVAFHKLAIPLLKDPSNGTRAVVGTFWSYDDLLNHIIKKESRFYRIFNRSAIDNDGSPRFSKLDLGTLENVKDSMGSYMFNMLYMNSATRPDDMVFDPKHIITLEETGITIPDDVDYIISCDPAASGNRDACDTAIVRCAHKRPMIFVDRVIYGKFTPMLTARHIVDLVEEDYEKTKWLSMEKNSIGEVMLPILRDLMVERGIYFPISPINEQKPKTDRIESMQPYFERSQILIRKSQKELFTQLINYPHYRKRDIIDALAQQMRWYKGYTRDKIHHTDIKTGNTLEEILADLRPKKSHLMNKGNRPPPLGSKYGKSSARALGREVARQMGAIN